MPAGIGLKRKRPYDFLGIFLIDVNLPAHRLFLTQKETVRFQDSLSYYQYSTCWKRIDQFKSEARMAKLKLDLHDIYNKGDQIDRELENIIDEAIEKKIKTVEIIPGKGSGQLKKRVLKFLDQKHIKQKYHRIDKDSKNFGRLFVYFKF